MTNANAGFSYNALLQIQKNWRNLSVSVAYNYAKSKDIMVGGSTAATMWGSMPVYTDPNKATPGYSNYYLPHRVIASASYRLDYAKHLGTSVGLIFEAAPAGTNSYIYTGDLNNDGNTSNDLMYIPTTDDINTYVKNGQLEAAKAVNGVNDLRTPQQIGAQLNAFINQDKYLSTHRGEVAQRNASGIPLVQTSGHEHHPGRLSDYRQRKEHDPPHPALYDGPAQRRQLPEPQLGRLQNAEHHHSADI
ncbi:hypothetical protein ACQ86N_11135 [Puia sp. P3]|uniref:hypothetical protein n=1 Tax=Puia sp. P3 TaxID=3423952 RepID=UPI003D67FE42